MQGTTRGLTQPVLAAGAFALAFAGGEALAQRVGEGNARVVIGVADVSQCAAAAVAGRFDDQTLQACNKALQQRLDRQVLIATRINRGAVHLRRREGDLALADFDEVIRLSPKLGDAHLNRGAALVLLQRPGPAVAAITTALGLGVGAPYKAYYNRGAAREQLGDVRGAYEDYSTALAIKPDWDIAEAEVQRFVRGRKEKLAAQLADGAGGPP
jgi:tetratricopeptide (TPR) repeat protein